MNNYNNHGFTLIELIIVIVILGILAVTAAPRFVDFSEDANDAVTVAKLSGFKAGVGLLHAKYMVRRTTPITIGDVSVDFNAAGWPTGSTNDSAGCADIWNKVFTEAEAINVAADFGSVLSKGWNAFAYGDLCGYIKSDGGGEAVYNSTSPHFVYYKADFSYSGGGYNYTGSAGDVLIYNL